MLHDAAPGGPKSLTLVLDGGARDGNTSGAAELDSLSGEPQRRWSVKRSDSSGSSKCHGEVRTLENSPSTPTSVTQKDPRQRVARSRTGTFMG